jgi:hypothetical protein
MTRYTLGMAGMLLACACLAALPAAAQVHADITASNLRYVLVDLTPDDGQASWFNFTQVDLSPVTISSAVTPVVGSEQDAHNNLKQSGLYEFSAHTQMSLALDVNFSIHAVPLSEPEQSAFAEIDFVTNAMWGPPKDRGTRRDSDMAYGQIGPSTPEGFRFDFDKDKTLWLTFVNDTDYAASGDFSIYLETIAHAMAAPVPEASTPAMLSLGLGLLGMLGRRRASNRSAAVAAAA